MLLTQRREASSEVSRHKAVGSLPMQPSLSEQHLADAAGKLEPLLDLAAKSDVERGALEKVPFGSLSTTATLSSGVAIAR